MSDDALHSPIPRRPLSIAVPVTPSDSPTPGRLKRLSLVASRDLSLSSPSGSRTPRSTPGGPSRSPFSPPNDDSFPYVPRSLVGSRAGSRGESEGRESRGSTIEGTDRGSEVEARDSFDSASWHRRSSWRGGTPRGVSGDALPTSPSPRPRHTGRTSSISYSPSINLSTPRRDRMTPSSRTWTGHDGDDEDKPRTSTDAALTLGEKHSDLLRMIAMRERRVNELKQELAVQEEALASLRSRWTAIARADTVAPTTSPAPATTAATTASPTPTSVPRSFRESLKEKGHSSTASFSSAVSAISGAVPLPPLIRTHPNSTSTSSTASSLPTVPDEEDTHAHQGPASPSAGAALGGLWNAISADADETIQEGKRFWGQLLRTVGAAAGGQVPAEGQGTHLERVRSGESERASSEFEIPRLSSLVSSLGFLPPTPAKPDDRLSLERKSSRSSVTSRSGLERRTSRSSAASRASRDPSPSKAQSSPTPVVEEVQEASEAAEAVPSLSLSPPAEGNDRRLSVRLKRAALNPKPRPLTGEADKEKEKKEDREERGTDSPRLVTAALESVGW